MLKKTQFKRLLPALFALTVLLPNPVLAYPGQTLEAFLAHNAGFKKTGSIFEPKFPNTRFEVWENFFFKEYPYSKYFLACDPTDRKGYVYLPKSLLIVKIEPGKKPLIISEAQSVRVENQDEVDVAVKAVETMVEKNHKPVTLWEKIREFIRSVSNEPLLTPILANGSLYVYHATYAEGRGSLVLMTPDFDSLPGKVPEGTRVGGVVKKVTYITAYEKMALGELADRIHAKRKSKERH